MGLSNMMINHTSRRSTDLLHGDLIVCLIRHDPVNSLVYFTNSGTLIFYGMVHNTCMSGVLQIVN